MCCSFWSWRQRAAVLVSRVGLCVDRVSTTTGDCVLAKLRKVRRERLGMRQDHRLGRGGVRPDSRPPRKRSRDPQRRSAGILLRDRSRTARPRAERKTPGICNILLPRSSRAVENATTTRPALRRPHVRGPAQRPAELRRNHLHRGK